MFGYSQSCCAWTWAWRWDWNLFASKSKTFVFYTLENPKFFNLGFSVLNKFSGVAFESCYSLKQFKPNLFSSSTLLLNDVTDVLYIWTRIFMHMLPLWMAIPGLKLTRKNYDKETWLDSWSRQFFPIKFSWRCGLN